LEQSLREIKAHMVRKVTLTDGSINSAATMLSAKYEFRIHGLLDDPIRLLFLESIGRML